MAPADTQDANGLSSFYVTVGWCVGGYLCASIMTISAGSGHNNPRRAVIRLTAMAAVGIAGGLGGALIVGPILGALPGSFRSFWGLGALIIFAVGTATLAFQGVFGLAGIGLVILLVVILGNPSAGGACLHHCSPRSGEPSAPHCHRAQAPGWPARSRTSRATPQPDHYWCCRHGQPQASR